MMSGCKKCRMVTAVLFFVLGVLFLLRDFGVWDFWNIEWWTALFLLLGISGLAMNKCPDCCAAMEGTSKKR